MIMHVFLSSWRRSAGPRRRPCATQARADAFSGLFMSWAVAEAGWFVSRDVGGTCTNRSFLRGDVVSENAHHGVIPVVDDGPAVIGDVVRVVRSGEGVHVILVLDIVV